MHLGRPPAKLWMLVRARQHQHNSQSFTKEHVAHRRRPVFDSHGQMRNAFVIITSLRSPECIMMMPEARFQGKECEKKEGLSGPVCSAIAVFTRLL